MKRPHLQFKTFAVFGGSKASGWKPVMLASIIASLAVGWLYIFRLGSLIGAGSGEMQTIHQVSSFSAIASNPLGLPYKLLAGLYVHLPGSDLWQGRLAAATIGLVCVGLFLLLAQRWYGAVNGIAATLLFATSGWLIQTSRYAASYGALVLMVLALLNLVVWLNNTDKSSLALLLYAAVGGLVLFIPGGIWFLLAATALSSHALLKHIKLAAGRQRIVCLGIMLLMICGLMAALVRDPSLIRQWAGLPADFPGFVVMAKQAALSVTGFVLRGPSDPEVWLAHTPILDAASSALLLIGVLFYSRHYGNARTRLLVSFALVGAILTALNGAPALGYIVPVVYLLLAGGLAYFMHQWKKIFPRNPIASATALAMLAILLLSIVSYHGQRYFVAWRYSPATVEAYQSVSRQTPAAGYHSLPYLIQ